MQTINSTNASLRELRVVYAEQELARRIQLLETKNSELEQECKVAFTLCSNTL